MTIICSSKDTIGILKALIAQKCGTVVGKIQLKMGYVHPLVFLIVIHTSSISGIYHLIAIVLYSMKQKLQTAVVWSCINLPVSLGRGGDSTKISVQQVLRARVESA